MKNPIEYMSFETELDRENFEYNLGIEEEEKAKAFAEKNKERLSNTKISHLVKIMIKEANSRGEIVDQEEVLAQAESELGIVDSKEVLQPLEDDVKNLSSEEFAIYHQLKSDDTLKKGSDGLIKEERREKILEAAQEEVDEMNKPILYEELSSEEYKEKFDLHEEGWEPREDDGITTAEMEKILGRMITE